MTARREDRRVTRTRRRLKQALLQLIEEVDYDDITVADIADRADVGRSTFYSHFDSKEDLLMAGFGRWLHELGGGGEAAGDATSRRPFAFSVPLLHHIRARPRFALTTLRRPANARIPRRFRATLAELAARDLDPPAEARAQAVAGAWIGIATWWLESGGRVPAEEVDAAFRSVISPTPVHPLAPAGHLSHPSHD